MIEMQQHQIKHEKESRLAAQMLQEGDDYQRKIKASNFRKPHESKLNLKFVNKSIHHTDNRE